MKIVYISAVPGHGASTVNMIITALMVSFRNRYRSILFQCGDKLESLDRYLLGKRQKAAVNMVSEKEFPFYYGKGLDILLKKVSIGRQIQRDEKSLLDCCIEIVPKDCYMLPSSTKRNPILYYNQMNMYISDIMSWCNREFDITFVDNSAGDYELYSRINEEADLIVINTSQNICEFQYAAELRQRLGRKRCVLLLGRYEAGCDDTIESLRHRFGLNRKNVFAICYDKNFLNALLTGNGVEYIKMCAGRLGGGDGKRAKSIREALFSYDDNFIKSLGEAYNGILEYVEALYANENKI